MCPINFVFMLCKVKKHAFSGYYLTNIKLFRVDIQFISTRVKIGKTRNCVEKRRPKSGVFSHNFEFSQFPRVLI